MIGLPTETAFLCNRKGDRLLDSLIFTGSAAAPVQHLWSAGRHIVQDGRHIARDRIRQDFLTVLRELESEI